MQTYFSLGWCLTLLGDASTVIVVSVIQRCLNIRAYAPSCTHLDGVFSPGGSVLLPSGLNPPSRWCPPPPWAAAWTRGPCPGCTHPGAGRGAGGEDRALFRSFIVVSVFGFGFVLSSLFRCLGSDPSSPTRTTARRGPYGPHKALGSTPRPTHPTHPPPKNRSNIFLCVFLWKLELYRLIFFGPSWSSAANQTANGKQKCAAAGRTMSPTDVGAGATITDAVASNRAPRLRPRRPQLTIVVP